MAYASCSTWVSSSFAELNVDRPMSVNCGACPGSWNVEITVVAAGQQYESASVIDNIRRVPKHPIFIGVIVDRVGGARRILDSYAVVQITSGDVIIRLPRHTAVLKNSA